MSGSEIRLVLQKICYWHVIASYSCDRKPCVAQLPHAPSIHGVILSRLQLLAVVEKVDATPALWAVLLKWFKGVAKCISVSLHLVFEYSVNKLKVSISVWNSKRFKVQSMQQWICWKNIYIKYSMSWGMRTDQEPGLEFWLLNASGVAASFKRITGHRCKTEGMYRQGRMQSCLGWERCLVRDSCSTRSSSTSRFLSTNGTAGLKLTASPSKRMARRARRVQTKACTQTGRNCLPSAATPQGV